MSSRLKARWPAIFVAIIALVVSGLGIAPSASADNGLIDVTYTSDGCGVSVNSNSMWPPNDEGERMEAFIENAEGGETYLPMASKVFYPGPGEHRVRVARVLNGNDYQNAGESTIVIPEGCQYDPAGPRPVDPTRDITATVARVCESNPEAYNLKIYAEVNGLPSDIGGTLEILGDDLYQEVAYKRGELITIAGIEDNFDSGRWGLYVNENPNWGGNGYVPRAFGNVIVEQGCVSPTTTPTATATATSTPTATATTTVTATPTVTATTSPTATATATTSPTQTSTATTSPTATVTTTATSTATPTVTTTVPTTTSAPTSSPSSTFTPKPPYEVAGYHKVNGRQWFTTCEIYSQTVRCRTDIWSKQVEHVGGKFVTKEGWHFNNLTYLPSKRILWEGNPLGNSGSYTINGRQWRTECDTPATGGNGCRSYIKSKVVQATKRGDGTYSYAMVTKFVFNNIVMFK